jgi:WD40 repeat protein
MRAHPIMIVAWLAAGSLLAACRPLGEAIPGLGLKKGIAELPYAGDRPDAPPLEERGNAVFTGAAYDDAGELLITQAWFGSAQMQVWNAKTGELLAGFDGFPPNPGSKNIWMIDSTRKRLLGKRQEQDALLLIDLLSGKIISTIDDPPDEKPAFAVGLLDDGAQALLFRPGVIETWELDPPRLALRKPSPFTAVRYFPNCVGGISATYNDKTCWEWSPDRRTLAIAFTPEEPVQAPTEYMLLDTTTLEIQRVPLPDEAIGRTFASFAFSRDGRWLALGTNEEMWLYDRHIPGWVRSIRGNHKRNNVLGPMAFTSDSKRLVALGDQLQVSVYDPETGIQLGRADPAFENWEGELKLSANGDRMVVYKFVSDTFEVLDSANANRIGYVCPYFCNVMHNPIQPPYAVSPDGTSVAISHRRGAAVWDTATDQIKFPLKDPKRKPLPYPMQR